MKKISAFLVSIFMLFAFTTFQADAKLFKKTQTETAPLEVEQTQDATIEENSTEKLTTESENSKSEEATNNEETTIEETTTVQEESTNSTEDTNNEIPVNNVSSQISDIPNDYWASTEINSVVKDGIIPLYDDGTFAPEVVVRRVDFAKWVLNALDNSTFQITVQNNFSDVNENTEGYETILRNDQLGLIYGYPDGTFRPEKVITKAETNSIMSHITKDVPAGETVLTPYVDKNNIPSWAVQTYEKTIRYGLFVNHPNPNELLPNKDLNRAEAAVLLYKLRNALNLVKKAYKSETILSTEHLNVTPLAPCNTVQITDKRIIVDQGNVIKVAFASNFNSKNYNVGDEVHFYAKEDIRTQEGTTVFPVGTKFLANIETLKDPQWLNKNATMTIAFKSATLPDGKCVEMQANAFENEGVLVSNKWEKPLLWTLGGTVVGTGIGLATGIPSDNTAVGLAVGIPTGVVVGAGIGFLTPGVNFGATQGDEIYVLITAPFSIYTCTPEDNS